MVASVPRSELVATADGRIVMRIGGWSNLEALLAMRGNAKPRITYLDGAVELMSPSYDHENIAWRIGVLVSLYCVERSIAFEPAGAWTLKDESADAALEPDCCYVFGTERKERPDLAIEVIGSGTIDKLEVYRRLGVREVWFWRDEALLVFELEGTSYQAREHSVALPELDLALVLELSHLESFSEAGRRMQEAARR